MRDEYDFSEAVKNPFSPNTKPQKTTITIRLDQSTVDYFKALSEQVNMPYQTLINSFLTDCAEHKKKPTLTWG